MIYPLCAISGGFSLEIWPLPGQNGSAARRKCQGVFDADDPSLIHGAGGGHIRQHPSLEIIRQALHEAVERWILDLDHVVMHAAVTRRSADGNLKGRSGCSAPGLTNGLVQAP